MDPPVKTARALSQLYTFQWHQWEAIWNGQLIRKYEGIPVHIKHTQISFLSKSWAIHIYGRQMNPTPYQTFMTTLQIKFSDCEIYQVTPMIDPPQYQTFIWWLC